MRQKEEIQRDIEEINEKIQALQSDIEKKGQELEQLKKVNAEALARTAGQGKKPKSLEVQQKKIFELGISIDQNRDAVGILKNQKETLEGELQLSEVEQVYIEPYRATEGPFFDRLEGIRTQFKTLQEEGKKLEKLLDGIMDAERPPFVFLGSLAGKVKDADKITKDLDFPIFKELRRYELFNEFMPFQTFFEENTMRKIDGFTSRLRNLEHIILREFRRKLVETDKGPISLGGTKGRLHKKNKLPADLQERIDRKKQRVRTSNK